MNPEQPEVPPPEIGSPLVSREVGVTPEEIRRLPALPGVYIMRDGAGKAIYIGKAVNLQSRVASYFTRSGDARFNVRFLLRHVERVETIITANEKEAFLLENTLIKKHQPRYNLRLRDDKTYVSVRIDMEHEWPRAVVLRRRKDGRDDGAVYLGPYSSAANVRQTLRQLQRIFPIRSCRDHVLRNRTRPCLLHSIGRCCAPCVKPVDRDEYLELVEGTILFLKGRQGEILKRLREQMRQFATDMEYERAAALRDRIQAIENTLERQAVHQHDGGDRDVIALERDGGYGSFVVFAHRNGLLVSSRPFLVRDHDRDSAGLMHEFLARFYEVEPPPREIVLSPLPESRELLEQVLTERRDPDADRGRPAARCQIVEPQRGEKRRLVEVARQNARRLLEQHLAGEQSVGETLREIAERLHLPAPPETLECFDISTIQGFATVGSMVTFRGGEPDKQRYRRFRIKSFDGQDDFGALREVLTRRFRRVAEGHEEPPSLAVIDGGRGQLGVAVAVFEELGLGGVPVVGMAKSRVRRRGDTTERTEERFFLPGRKNPVVLKSNSPALYLLVRLRDEAHRFGITYHRELRGRRNLRSVLEDLPGVGKTRASALLRRFGSLKKLREASPEQIAETPRVPEDLARRIHEYLRASAPPEPDPDEEATAVEESKDRSTENT